MTSKEKLANYAELYGAGEIKLALILGQYPTGRKPL